MTPLRPGLSAATAWCVRQGPVASIDEMPGGASARRFYRVQFADGTGGVAMFFPDPASTGAARLRNPPARWPFIEIQETLARHDIAVPKVLVADCDSGWLLIEDLGRESLADYLERKPGAREAVYTLAVEDVARAQQLLHRLPSESVIRQRSFDFDFLSGEMEHFREYGLEARGILMSGEQRQSWETLTRRVCQRIAALPYSFSHRDYQSTNLMVGEPLRLTWIDFQDAAWGPRVYDLVALLHDSYQSFDEEFVAARLRDYVKTCACSEAQALELRQEFDLVTVQRKLKDAGRFVFIEERKGDDGYRKYVKPTISLVMKTLRRREDDEDFVGLFALLTELGLSTA